ncbi:unnamed protein product [Caenorhabditis sp. 36 PRJEB53466]|nr:unnamed protein product [Caenorhabditis sp. 36 PRJEB53466]
MKELANISMFRTCVSPAYQTKLLIDLDGYEMAKQRFDKLLEECGEKCAPIDFTTEFIDASIDEQSKNFRYFNFLGFSYFTSGNHLTPNF